MKLRGRGKRYKGGELFWDLLFPKRCPVCDGIVKIGKGYICEECTKNLRFVGEPLCMKCGKPLEEEAEYCADCRRREHPYRQGAAVFEYGSIAASVYRFKYKGRQEYAEFFGRCMAESLRAEWARWKPEALLPVPIHSSRKRKRGYNQAELLAEVVSEQTGIPVRKDLLVRDKKTIPQKELDGSGRQNNLKKAFKIIKNDVKLNTIVIIDDIYTTGSTVDAITRELHKAGVPNVYYAALAIGKSM